MVKRGFHNSTMNKSAELEKGMHEEITLVPLKHKENILHDELIQFLDGDETDDDNLQATAGIDCAYTSTSIQTNTLKDAYDFFSKDETIPPYIEEFEKDAQDDIIVLGSLSQKQDFKCQEDYFQSGRKLFYRRSNQTFKKKESQLLNAANAHKEKILAKLGNISEVNNESNGAAGLCWKTGWSDTSQPIQIVLKCLRGVKDKIPKGHYVLKTSLLSRPGGHALHWSKVKDQHWAGTTLPLYHKGGFYDVEMNVNYAVHTNITCSVSDKDGRTMRDFRESESGNTRARGSWRDSGGVRSLLSGPSRFPRTTKARTLATAFTAGVLAYSGWESQDPGIGEGTVEPRLVETDKEASQDQGC
ncbi:uncharacterized protein LOC143783277 [Ranitomeya variabilis]|uniref:uncharacterized protein LOC143783277 n=1 Tax=Ranitomeya variabilis TaxID=490064 RepID=UPI004056809B